MTQTAAEVAQILLQINAIKLNPQKPFTWASGLRAPIYCDNRIILSHPVERRQIIRHFARQAEAFRPFDTIGGVATAGIPHGVLLAEQLDLPFLYLRSKAKAHGRQNQIEGRLDDGARVLLIEDLISTGGSSLKAVEALRAAGAAVVGVLAIFTYGFTRAAEAFRQAGCPLQTLSNYDTLLQEAARSAYVTEADILTLQAWRQDPENWSPVRT